MQNEILKTASIGAHVQARNAIRERIETIFRMEKEIEEVAKGLDIFAYGLLPSTADRPREDDLLGRVDADFWNALLEKSDIRNFVDSKTREKWDKDIADRKFPEFVPKNVAETFAALYAKRREMFGDSVVNVFKSLSWNYKTNRPRMFGKRLVLTYAVTSYAPSRRISGVQYRAKNKLDDLDRVFRILDGKPVAGCEHALGNVLDHAIRDGAEKFGNEYFEFKWFLNGNLHVKFLQPDLVKAANALLAERSPGALPVARSA